MWSFIYSIVSPKKFFLFSSRSEPWLLLCFLFFFSYGLIGGLWFAPADYLQGDAFRIIYVHAPCAFLSLFIYVIMAGAAASDIVLHLQLATLVIRKSAPLGAMFTLLALITGCLWGKPMWGTWWIWDARLTSELILLFLYLGIILLQSALSQKQSSKRAVSILILVGFIDVPIIHYSVYWWNTLHQGATLNIFTPSTIDHSMLYPLLSMIAAFFVYYIMVLFLHMNYELTASRDNHHWITKEK